MFNLFKRRKHQKSNSDIILTPEKTSHELLEILVEELKPVLKNFQYERGQTATSSGGRFANGFFVNEKVKIGLIYRSENLGLVIYEIPGGNISHDDLFKLLGKESDKNLFYDKDCFKSYTTLEAGLNQALVLDMQNVIVPFINETSRERIENLIQEAYKKRWD